MNPDADDFMYEFGHDWMLTPHGKRLMGIDDEESWGEPCCEAGTSRKSKESRPSAKQISSTVPDHFPATAADWAKITDTPEQVANLIANA